MGTIDALLENNARYSEGFTGGGRKAPPSRKVAVLTCMDARLDVVALLGLDVGEAHMIRNAGGAVTEDAIRSLTISQRLLGTREIMIIQHTDCGMQQFSGVELKDLIERETGVRPPFALETFKNLEANVRKSVARAKESPFLAHKDVVRGFVYDVDSGRLKEVT
jgi:carbonic anhydrase